MIKKDEENKKVGRTKIDNIARKNSFSKRALEGQINVINLFCFYCGHKKAFKKPKGTFCTRCGKEARNEKHK